MVDFNMRSVQQASLTTGDIATTQDFTVSGFGTPVAWIITTCYGSTLGTIRASSSLGFSWGFAAGADDRGLFTSSLNGVGTGNPYGSSGSTNGSARLLVPSLNTNELLATVAAITDGVQLTYTTKPVTAVQVRVDLIMCDAAESAARVSTTSTGVVEVLAGAFEPSLIFTQSTAGAIANGLRGGIGFACQTQAGVITQGAWGQRFRTSANVPPNLGAMSRAGHFVMGLNVSGASFLEQAYTLDSFNVDGFTFSRAIGTGSMAFSYLAIAAPLKDFWCGWESTATSISTQAISTPGFAAAGGWFLPTYLTTLDAGETDTTINVVGLNAWSGSEQYSASVSIDDASDPSAASSLASANGFDVLQVDGTLGISATVASAGSGFALTISDADATARLFLAVVYSASDVYEAVDEVLGIEEEVLAAGFVAVQEVLGILEEVVYATFDALPSDAARDGEGSNTGVVTGEGGYARVTEGE